MLEAEAIAAVMIALGTLGGAVRLLWWRHDWRAGVLAALMLASGMLLYCAFFPPRLPVGGETLLVATAETPADTRAGAGERLIALPEAPRLADAERVPDLATALRRHPQARRIRIFGRGLHQRDRDTNVGLPVEFVPLPSPRGLVRLDPPADTPAGAGFALAGETAGLDGGTAELLDPAGRKVDSRKIGTDQRFTLGGAARAAGLAAFTLRLRDRSGRPVSDTPVPLRAYADAPIRVLLVGAPSPEVKFLRRWAEDAGIDLSSRLDAGGGADLGSETRVTLDPASLRKADVVIIDDRSLAGLGSTGRAALAEAVAGGLGLVVRMTAPADAGTRASWRALGLGVEGGGEALPVALPPLAADADALAAQRGPALADTANGLNTFDDPAPELGHWAVKTGPDIVTAVADAEGAMLAGWQQIGEGRIALWTLANSFALVLGGQSDRYYQWWSDTVSAVARPDSAFLPAVPALALAGERSTICRIAPGARIIDPDGQTVALAIDPAAGPAGCAAWWPTQAGVHRIIQPERGEDQEFAVLVLPDQALAALKARETAEATSLWAAAQSAPAAHGLPEQQGPRWPWFLGWLLASGALWFAERRWRLAPPAS